MNRIRHLEALVGGPWERDRCADCGGPGAPGGKIPLEWMRLLVRSDLTPAERDEAQQLEELIVSQPPRCSICGRPTLRGILL